ncbi:MAG: hypothetical protein U9P14_07795, partial [Gemmatimonadota bacterium]|nr:hypothetical protein [Gemmatimonadota bacterium]
HNPTLALFRNNIAIGGTGGQPRDGLHGHYSSGTGLAASFLQASQTCDMDYNGYGTCGTPFRGQIGKAIFSSLAELKKLTSEKHAVKVDMSIFKPGVEFPDPAIPEREPADLRLAAGSAAVDAGEFIPGINDGFEGSAPDLGAYELGEKLPHYGPRAPGVDEETDWGIEEKGK